jgi:hypothetical protein
MCWILRGRGVAAAGRALLVIVLPPARVHAVQDGLALVLAALNGHLASSPSCSLRLSLVELGITRLGTAGGRHGE